MKEAMRDKVCQLIGKYQAEEAFHREKLVLSIPRTGPAQTPSRLRAAGTF